jgi:hypothetical protein
VLFVELVRPFVEFLRAERFERSHFWFPLNLIFI